MSLEINYIQNDVENKQSESMNTQYIKFYFEKNINESDKN